MSKTVKRPRRSADHALVQIPGLGVFDGSVGAKDVMVGAGLGLAGTAGLKYALNKSGMMASLPDFALKAFPLLASAVTGGAAYAIQKKKNSSRAKSHFVGAVAAGAAVTAWDVLRNNVPDLSDLVSVRLNGYRGYNRGMGVLVADNPGRLAGYNGVIINDSSRNLAELNALNMTPDNDD